MNNFGIWSNFSGSTLPPTRPAIRFPTEVARNQIPIIWPTYLRGESFVIVDRPTGLKTQLANCLEEVTDYQPHRRNLERSATANDHVRSRNHDREAKSGKQQSE